MGAPRAANRAMFWRIIRRLLGANPGRLFVILLALGAGAGVTAALLNLQVDAERRLTSEFTAFGPNVLIAPHSANSTNNNGSTLDESILNRFPLFTAEGRKVNASAYFYLIGDVSAAGQADHQRVVIAGIHNLAAANPANETKADLQSPESQACIVGRNVVALMHLQVGDRISVRGNGKQEPCRIASVTQNGGAEDGQVLPTLDFAQRLADSLGRISLIQLTVPGTSREIDNYIASLQQQFPAADVRPIRQFTEGEAKIYNRISGLLSTTVGIVLLLTALCVMAAMTNVAMERKMDVGLMKAIGGATRRVVRLFLAEAALLGLAGGLIGAAAGIALSIGLGKAVFGVAARPRLIVYPVSVALTMLVSILSSYPLRRLATLRPASVFRGEA